MTKVGVPDLISFKKIQTRGVPLQLFSYYFPETADWDQYFKLMILIPLILCCQVRELKHLVPFSFIANTMMVIAFGITLYYIFSGITQVKLSDRKLATGWEGMSISI